MTHEEIQLVYKDHLYLSYMNKGGSKKLVGDVIVIALFINDNESRWTETAKEEYKKIQHNAMRALIDTARQNGADLQIRNAYAELDVDMTCSRENYDDWTEAIIRKYNKNTILEYQDYFKKKHQCDEAPFLFVFNKPFRSYAVAANAHTGPYGEMAMLSLEKCSERTIVHELLHQFGARDLYFPRELREMVEKLQYKSVMATGGAQDVDSLTAYLIGWTREINLDAVRIFEATKHYTFKSFRELLLREWGDT